MTVSLTNVIAVGIDDEPGAFSKAVRLLADEGFDMEYMYAFISRDKGKAFCDYPDEQRSESAEVLKERRFDILSPGNALQHVSGS